MREIYNGAEFSLNELKGNFHWPSQTNDKKFDRTQFFYGVYISGINRTTEVNLLRLGTQYLNQHILSLQSPLIKRGETLYCRTQQDLIEFLQLNQHLFLF